MTRGRKILTWSLASLVLLLAALVVFIATFDWNLIKPTLNEKVSAALNRPFAINGNLWVRTLTLMFAFGFLTAMGARQGDVILAANAVLMQLFTVLTYGLDGFAPAVQ